MNQEAPRCAFEALNSWADLFDPRLASYVGNHVPYVQGSELTILKRAENPEFQWIQAAATRLHGSEKRTFMTIILFNRMDESTYFLGELDPAICEELASQGPEQILAYRASPAVA
jgi:hypothetical protein